MSFFERFRTTLRADAHGLIDAFEEPTLMLKQYLRDAELAVQKAGAKERTEFVKRTSTMPGSGSSATTSPNSRARVSTKTPGPHPTSSSRPVPSNDSSRAMVSASCAE